MITTELMSVVESVPEAVFFNVNRKEELGTLGDFLSKKLHIGQRELEETCVDSDEYDEDLLWSPCEDFCLVVGSENLVGQPDAVLITECHDVIGYYKL